MSRRRRLYDKEVESQREGREKEYEEEELEGRQ